MRDIKFRAFIKDSHEMACLATSEIYKVTEIDFADKYVTVEDEKRMIDVVGFEDCELLQFTGLTDKNGVQIYEGDIVEGYKGGSDNDRYYKGFLEWNQQQGGFVIRCGKYIMEILSLATEGFDCTLIISKFEVIGNIHQNSPF